ncbi:MAG: FtsX-like permease family protein [Phycisphaerales bacterium]|nr:MAG: FtsX-like permease family protein [Phycisphaerales bacterium]
MGRAGRGDADRHEHAPARRRDARRGDARVIIVRLLTQTVALALGQIRANKARALLTSLGIIIGVASVTAVIASLTGMRASVLSDFETFGARKIFVWGQVPREMRGRLSWDQVRLTPEEGVAILENAPSIEALSMQHFATYEVQRGAALVRGVQVVGIQPDWHTIEDRHVTLGRTFSRIDEEERRPVCLINDKAIEELDLGADPVGVHITIGGRRFLIVGVVETKEVGPIFGGDGETRTEVYIPFATSVKLSPHSWMNAIAQLRSPELSDDAIAEVRFILRNSRGQQPGEPDTFNVEVMQQHIDSFNALAGGITAIAGGVVSVSLLVGGIGIMNIMLVSVSERTREIGLRKAVGARPAVILTQFLVEAVTLCLVGGLIGLLIGQALTMGLRMMPGANLEDAFIPTWAMGLAFAFSAGVGVVFGMFPAIKASRLDPIQALRHE